MTSVCYIASELTALAGPEIIMMALGMLTYILFSSYNFLPTYWSHYDAHFPNTLAEIEEKKAKQEPEKKLKEAAAAQQEEEPLVLEEKKEEASPAALAPTKQEAPLIIQALAQGGLDLNSVAQVFLSTELSQIGAMGCTCKAAKEGIWEDKDLWLEMGGACFLSEKNFSSSNEKRNEIEDEKEDSDSDSSGCESDHVSTTSETSTTASISEIRATTTAKELRENFRTWVYGLGGNWSTTFAETANTRHQADVFQEAAFLLGGLQKTDGADGSIEEFGVCLVEQLRLLDAGEELATTAARQLMQKAKTRTDLLGNSCLSEMQKAFDESEEYARKVAARMEAF